MPSTHADEMRKILAEAGAGHIGNYDTCSFSTKGTGRYRGLEGTKPFLGKSGKLQQAEEEKIETICPFEKYKQVVDAIKKIHPYEEPAIDIIPLLNK